MISNYCKFVRATLNKKCKSVHNNGMKKCKIGKHSAKNVEKTPLFCYASNDKKNNFDNISDLNTFFRNLFILVGKTLPKREGLIIFDEVQFCPKARQAIKQLVKDGRYDYIETGSLISITKNVRDILIPSEEESIKMFPMDFEEFLWANDNNIYADAIRDAFEKKKPIGDAIHRKIMQTFRTYIAVGGMPQAVSAYVDGKDYKSIDRIKRNIVNLYIKDLEKHDKDDGDRAGLVFKSVPEQLSNHNSVFKLSVVDESAEREIVQMLWNS